MFSSREGGKGWNEIHIEAQTWMGKFKDTYIKEMYPGRHSVKNLPANAGDSILSLSGEDPLEEGLATHSSILVWEIQ